MMFFDGGFMKHSSRPTRRPANLSESMHRQLSAYALAASAAGVGVLAWPQAAEAKIVYTPAHIRVNGGFLALDLNHDGVVDYSVHTHRYNSYFWELWVSPSGENQVRAGSANRYKSFYAAALPAGVRLGPKRKWVPGGTMLDWVFFTSTGTHTGHAGPWFDVQRRYLGLKFFIHGHFHYGWARLNVKGTPQGIDAVLTGYAYETIPNTPIITGKTKGPDEIGSVAQPNPASVTAPVPKPATLGALALGFPGLSIWRREESTEISR
jgi:hypothetical protein